MNLKKKIISGVLWSLVEKGGQQVLSLLVFLVLARILGPEEYGIANVCFIFFSLTTMLTTGLVDGIVSNQIEDNLKLSSLFWGVIVTGLIISILCITLAQPLSILMGTPSLAGLLSWFAVVPMLTSLAAIPNLLLLKELNFRVYAIRSIISTIIGGTIGIYMALNEFGAYAIVGQQIAIHTLNNFIIWLSIDWKPQAIFKKEIFFKEVKPGVAVASVNLLSFLNEQSPRFFIATIIGPTALGFYALATRLRFSLTEILVNSPLNVIYPAIAKLNQDIIKQQKVISIIIYLSGMIIFPILTIGIITAEQYVPLFFGNHWIKSIPILQIFLFMSMFSPFIVIIQQLFRAKNKMRVFLKVRSYLIIASISTSILLFFENGLILMTLALLAVTIASVAIYTWLLNKTVQIDISQDLKQLHMPFIGCIIIYSSIAIFKHNINQNLSYSSILTISLILSIISYTLFCIVFGKDKILITMQQINRKN